MVPPRRQDGIRVTDRECLPSASVREGGVVEASLTVESYYALTPWEEGRGVMVGGCQEAGANMGVEEGNIGGGVALGRRG